MSTLPKARPGERLATISMWGTTTWIHEGIRDVGPIGYVLVSKNVYQLPAQVTKIPWDGPASISVDDG